MQAARDLATANPMPPLPLSDDECVRRMRELFPGISAAFVIEYANYERGARQDGHCRSDWCERFADWLLQFARYPKEETPAPIWPAEMQELRRPPETPTGVVARQNVGNSRAGAAPGGAIRPHYGGGAVDIATAVHKRERPDADVVGGPVDDTADAPVAGGGRRGAGGDNENDAAIINRYSTAMRSANTKVVQAALLRTEFTQFNATKVRKSLVGNTLFNAYVALHEERHNILERGGGNGNVTNNNRQLGPLKGDGSLEDELLAAKKYVIGRARTAPLTPGRVPNAEKQHDQRLAKKHRPSIPATNGGSSAQLVAKPNELATFECFCCGDQEALQINRVVCNGPQRHSYCRDCVGRYIAAQLDIRSTRIDCFMDAACAAPFTLAQLQACTDAPGRRRLSDALLESQLADAGVADHLHRCPKCNFRAEPPPLEDDSLFACPDCRHVSCRRCMMPAHKPSTCAQAAAQKMLEDKGALLHAVEEAMSQALIRRCNRCGTPFVKEFGCNKMTCANSVCRNKQCYICGQNVVNYNHFNDRTCPLYDNAVPLHIRHQRDVEGARARAVALLAQKYPDIPAETFREAVAKQMNKPSGK